MKTKCFVVVKLKKHFWFIKATLPREKHKTLSLNRNKKDKIELWGWKLKLNLIQSMNKQKAIMKIFKKVSTKWKIKSWKEQTWWWRDSSVDMTDGNKRRREKETKWGGNHFSSNHVALITPHKPTNCFCPFPLSAGLLNLPLDPISCSFCLLPFSKRQCASALKGWSSISYRLWSNCGKNTTKAFKRNGPNVEHPGAWRTSWLVTWPRPKRTWDPAELTATFTPSRLFGPVLWPDSVLKKIQAERSRKQEMRAESKRPQCIPSYPQCLAASWANTFSITADPSGNETSNPGSIGAALLSIDRQQRTSRGQLSQSMRLRHFVHFIPTTSATFHFFFFFPLLFAAPASALLRPHMFNTHTRTHTQTRISGSRCQPTGSSLG